MLFKRLHPLMDADTGSEGYQESYQADNTGEVAELQTGQVQETQEQTQTETQDITQTQSFARRLKEQTQRAIDAEYDKLYGVEYGIHSKAEFDAYVEKQNMYEQAAKEGKDPELYELKKEVESFKREKTLMEQDKKLSSDPMYGQFYSEWKSEVEQISNQFNVDLNAAFTILCRDKLPTLLSDYKQKLEVVQSNQRNASSSTGALTGQGSVPNDFISKDTFEMNKGNQRWIQDNYDKLRQSMKKW